MRHHVPYFQQQKIRDQLRQESTLIHLKAIRKSAKAQVL